MTGAASVKFYIDFSFFLLLSPADLEIFVVGFLVSLICTGMQMFLKMTGKGMFC